MRQPDLKRARRRAYEKRRRNWELSPQRRHEIKSIKQYYAELDAITDSDSTAIYGLRPLKRCPRKSSQFCN